MFKTIAEVFNIAFGIVTCLLLSLGLAGVLLLLAEPTISNDPESVRLVANQITWLLGLAIGCGTAGKIMAKLQEELHLLEVNGPKPKGKTSPKYAKKSYMIEIPWKCKTCEKSGMVYISKDSTLADTLISIQEHHLAMSHVCSGIATMLPEKLIGNYLELAHQH